MAPYITKYISFLLIAAEEATAFAPNHARPGGATLDTSSSSSTIQSSSQQQHWHQSSAVGPLYEAKNNDRARMEKSWENMMGEDWREFRAHLVADEQAENDSPIKIDKNNGKQQSSSIKEEGMGKFITGAISSMFSKGGESATEDANLFEGDAVGGATKFSKMEVSSGCSDPFMTDEECHIMFDEKEVTLDKHRWSHPLFHVEPGCILVANEKLGGVFHQTVVLIIDHNEAAGSTGLVINRPFAGNLMKIGSESESNIDLSLKMAFSKAPVSYGGPVMQEQFSTLHGFGEVEGSKKVCPGVFVGGSSQLMQEVRRNNLHPTEVLFVKGHAAWVPGQLTREIEKGVWYVAAASADLILRYAGAPVSKDDNPEDLWADILSCMGDKFENIATSHSSRGDDRMLA